MRLIHSIAPSALRESVGNLVEKLQAAVEAGDAGALERRLRRLSGALRAYDPLFRATGLRDPDAVDEGRHLTLEKLHRKLTQGHRVAGSAEGWARAVARNTARDLVRERRRVSARETELDPERPLPAPEPMELKPDFDELRDRMFRLFMLCGLVTRCSGRRRAERLRALMAWYLLRIARIPADRIALKLGATKLAGGGVNAVYKWAERGAAQARQIAEADPESEWAALLRRAAEARH